METKSKYIKKNYQFFKICKNVFQKFLYGNFKDYEIDSYISPVSNKPANLYGTVKTRKFQNLVDITPSNLKCCQIADETEKIT